MSFRNQTKPTHNVTGTLKVLERLNKYEFAVEIEIMREGLNNNNWDYRNVDKHFKTFIGQPILIAYVGTKVGDGHNMRKVQKPNGEFVYTFMDGTAERIIGTLSDDEKDFRIEEKDGRKWIVAKGKIFAFYAREAVEKIIATGAMSVSAETDIYDSEETADGVEIFNEWAGLGVTILGDDVPPAIPGARIKALKALREEFNSMKVQVASMVQADNDDEDDLPEDEKGVNKTMTKRELATLQEKFTDHIVLNASEDGKHVCLLSKKDGTPCGYTFGNEADMNAVVPERIKPMRVNAAFVFDSENTVNVDVAAVTDDLAARNMTANQELTAEKGKVEKLENDLKTMCKQEDERRVEAATKAVRDKLTMLNANREDKFAFDSKLADEVIARINEGHFTRDERDGKWCGDENAVNELMAKCMKAQAEMDKGVSKNNKYFAWNNEVKRENKGSIAELIEFANR